MNRLIFHAVLLGAALAARVSGAPAMEGGYRAGAAKVDITPAAFPVRVNGGFLEKTATQAHDRLHARALVIANGHERVAIRVVDTCMLPRELIDAAVNGDVMRPGKDHISAVAEHGAVDGSTVKLIKDAVHQVCLERMHSIHRENTLYVV